MMKFDGKSEVVLSNLLSEIQDKSLEMILRRVIFSGENVIDVVKQERPETKTLKKYGIL